MKHNILTTKDKKFWSEKSCHYYNSRKLNIKADHKRPKKYIDSLVVFRLNGKGTGTTGPTNRHSGFFLSTKKSSQYGVAFTIPYQGQTWLKYAAVTTLVSIALQ
jgi:hypothetical protein